MFHGTHVSGTIGAVGGNRSGIVGVAWHVSLMPVKFIDSDGTGTYSGGIGSILYAVDHGAKVINCSWGGNDDSQALKDAVDYAKSKGVLIVAAAGNDGTDTDSAPLYPADLDCDNVISVTSIFDETGTLSYFSNYGVETVDIAAPGERVYSTFNPTYQLDRVYYEYLDGTSMATPHVSGAIALAYAANPHLTWREMKDLVLSTGRKTAKLEGKIKSGAILDVGALVTAASKLAH
jgi:subtilisin family serine protease